MATNTDRWQLGRRIAPPVFVLFGAVFLALLAVLIPWVGAGRGTMAAFDLAAIVSLAKMATLLGRKAADIRRTAADNDANRTLLLVVTGVIMIVILVAVAGELKGKNDALAVVLVITTLVLAWLFSNMVYAFHYAHLFYSDGEGGEAAGGLDFPKTEHPEYWEFIYFSFTLGMTFQTSDVEISSTTVRRAAIGQCLAAFVFNLGVLAFTINVLGGGSH